MAAEQLCLLCAPNACECPRPAGPRVVDIFTKREIQPGALDQDLADMRERGAKQLEEIVADMRAGQIMGFAIAFSFVGGGTGSVCSDDVATMPIEYLGALDRLKHRINLEQDFDSGYFGDED